MARKLLVNEELFCAGAWPTRKVRTREYHYDELADDQRMLREWDGSYQKLGLVFFCFWFSAAMGEGLALGSDFASFISAFRAAVRSEGMEDILNASQAHSSGEYFRRRCSSSYGNVLC